MLSVGCGSKDVVVLLDGRNNVEDTWVVSNDIAGTPLTIQNDMGKTSPSGR